jgi:hypothetical protein
MATGQVHYEVFGRRGADGAWRLEGASESRSQAVELAQNLFNARKVSGVKVLKEVLDPATREYTSYLVTAIGMVEDQPKKKMVVKESTEPACVSPQDLYAAHARDKVGRVLDDFLRRRKVVVFELMHRADLAEGLEASSMELKHAIQKIAVPESQNTGAPVHELMRTYEKLAQTTIERVIQTGRKGLFPDLDKEPLDKAAARLIEHADRLFLMGGAVAKRLADAPDWNAKVDRLLDMAEASPEEPKAKALCRVVIEQLLSEILGSRSGLSDLLGPDLDKGAALLALTRLVSPLEVEAVMAADPSIRSLVPEMSGPAARLAVLMRAEAFNALRTALGRKILSELNSAARLRPTDPDGEIAVLRALAMVLTASAGRLLSLDEVQAVFLERSKLLTASDFVSALQQGRPTVLAEAQALVRMAENCMGPLNRARAAEWLQTCLDSLKFESEFRAGGADTAIVRLSALAVLDRSIRRTGFGEGDQLKLCTRLGEVAGLVEADAKLLAQLMRSPSPAPQKATMLLRLATGDFAPPGPVADRAKAALMHLLKTPETRAELAASPDVVNKVRELMAA